MPQSTGSIADRIQFALTRIIVPLWVLAGAMFKLFEGTPDKLPKGIWQAATKLHIDLFVLLATLIALEILAAAVMLFLARLARPMAIFMLTAFCLILLNEMRLGNFTNCGCFGKLPVKPWQVLTIDGTLLAGVLLGLFFFRTPAAVQPRTWRFGPIAAGLMILLGAAASFGLILPDRHTPTPQPLMKNGGIAPRIPNPPSTTSLPDATQPAQPPGHNAPETAPALPPPDATQLAPVDPTVNPNPMELPRFVLADNLDQWVGKPWRELEIFKVMARWPSGMDRGKRFVVFYSRNCEHCEAMFKETLIGPIGAIVTAVEVPISRTEMHGADGWEMPTTQCELLELPLGPVWMFTPPLALAVQDGIVTCATEQEYKKCLGLE